MSKERLEEIKEHLHQIRSVLGLVGDQFTVNRAGELEVLIDEQAERVEDLKTINKELHDRRRVLRKQNKRYREAIENALTEGEFEDAHTQLERIVTTLNEALEVNHEGD